jgi:hypothetical protein
VPYKSLGYFLSGKPFARRRKSAMPEDGVIGKEREAEFNFYEELFSVIENRSFAKQIRSEECGNCTAIIAQKIFEGVCSSEASSFLVWTRLIEKIISFCHLPRFTEKVLESGELFMRMQISQEVEHLSNSPHTCLKTAIEELVFLAKKVYAKSHYLLFCRIAEPIFRTAPNYKLLCDEANIPESQRAMSVIKTLEAFRTELINKQKDPDLFIKGAKFPPAKKMKRKAVWSGGVCDILKSEDGQAASGTTRMKIIGFNPHEMKVYTRKTLKPAQVYTCTISFNCVDLPFMSEVTVEKEITNLPRYHREFMTKCKVEHCYLLKFVSNTDELKPHPHYYFLCMCHELFEQHRDWDAEVFAEVFCDAQWAPAALGEAQHV